MIQTKTEQEKIELEHTDPVIATNGGLIAEFERGLAPEGFHHADHVRVAFAYVSELPLLEALARFSAALKRFALAQGKPNLYHETITWIYLFLIAERSDLPGRTQTWEEFAECNADLLKWKDGILEKYYEPTTLWSDRARHRFVLPDRGPSDHANSEQKPSREGAPEKA